ncbi:MAG: cysteine desulfurase [Bacteriovoracaceae bacterium]|nr:cysteine desulfurase [Bacteriovoracaceae bacterium]
MIYADYNGSAPLLEDVKQYLKTRVDSLYFANPNAIHYLGAKTKLAMENARVAITKVLGADKSQAIYTSGATEGINTVFHSLLSGEQYKEKPYIVLSGIEHPAVSSCAKYYEKKGYILKTISSNNNGTVDILDLKNILNKYKNHISLVTVIAANNETGVIQPYEEVSALCEHYEVPNLSDTTQLIGKIPFNFKKLGMDYAVMSGHKLGALTGAGVLLAKDPSRIKPLILGGGQESNLRSGTGNYLGFESMAIALDYIHKNMDKWSEVQKHRISFEKRLKERFSEIVILGEDAPRLANTSYISYPGIHGQTVQIELESHDIFVTTSSACSDNEPMTSSVLKAMNITDDVGRGVVRISMGINSSARDYDQLLEALIKSYQKLMLVRPF